MLNEDLSSQAPRARCGAIKLHLFLFNSPKCQNIFTINDEGKEQLLTFKKLKLADV